MNLAYEKDGDNYKPIFVGDSFEEKLIQYDSFEEEENKYEFLLGVVRRVTYLITLWFLGRADTSEDFTAFDKSFLKENKLETEEPKKEEAKKTEEVKVEEIKVEETVSIIEEIKPE
jgi:hypothetical protein